MAKLPGEETEMMQRSDVAAFAKIVSHRCNQLGAFENIESTPVLNSMFTRKEPKSGTNGTLSWTVDVYNPATGDDFCMIVKELELPDGTHRPYSVWLSGEFPENLNGLCKSLSIDMRVYDTNWISKKLSGLADFPEHKGDFLAKVPGSSKMESMPSTIAYIARLIQHRYKMLSIFNDEGLPVIDMGMFLAEESGDEISVESTGVAYTPGKKCKTCGINAVVKYDGCERCTNCGEIGQCG
jgi:ribonucleoside-diphosphate reductase alpha chain